MPTPRAVPRRPVTPIAALAALVVIASSLVVGGASSASATEVAPFPASGNVGFHDNGNGHGHGLSQYGARGAAIAGLSSSQILAFYYPGSTLSTLAASTIRVKLSGGTTYTTVAAGTTGLTITKFGTLPTTGYAMFRLVPTSTGLSLQGEKLGTTTWTVLNAAMPAQSDFSSTAGFVRLLLASGSWTRYRGSIGALRTSSTAEMTINRVLLDQYTEGVVPREMPASWQAAAVQAQAVAARSYAKSEMAAHGSSTYDICDTTSCQVYGGYQHVSADLKTIIWTDDPAAIVGNENKVLTYQGAPVFAQFSASNGGASTYGGKPYLAARVDPYDNISAGDPYIYRADSTSVTALAAAYGLKTITSVQITKRDGLGTWGGRVLTANVVGTTSTGAAKTVATDGSTLASGIGAHTTFFRFDTEAAVPTAPVSVKAAPGDAGATISWTAPSNAASAPVKNYLVSFSVHTVTVSGTARSLYVSPIYDYTNQVVTVTAVGSAGSSPPVAISVKSVPAPQGLVPLPPASIFATTQPPVTVDSTHPFVFDLAGKGGIPVGAKAAQLVVGLQSATASGVVTVYNSGVAPMMVAAIAYSPTYYTAATVTIPLIASTKVVFAPSAGSLVIRTSVAGYSSATGSKIALVTPTTVANLAEVPVGTGTTVSLASVPGISSATTGVIVQVDGVAHSSPNWLRMWADGGAFPSNVYQVALSPGAPNVNTLILPVPASHLLRIAAGTTGLSGRVTVVALLGSGVGRLETFPVSVTADNVVPPTPSATVGTTAVPVKVAGVGQVLSAGAAAVLAHITVSSTVAGSLYAYATGATKPAVPTVVFSGKGSQTTTALLRLGPDGKVNFVSSVPGVVVSIDSMGYVTTS